MNDSTTPLWLQVPEPSDLVKAFGSAVDVPAFGGRLEVNWAPGARVTSAGGLVYFATFLKATGLFDRLCADFPVEYASNNASSKRDIVGTAVLAILLGKTRYVHIEAIRHDEAAKELLGLDEIVSDATVRRAFKRGSERELDEWLSRHEREVYEVLLSFKYILDIDNTVKPIYGHQEGAELGYNPTKPGRPSHNYHSFFIGRARISLGVEVLPGKQHSGRCGMKRLWALIDSLPPHLWPSLLRGDVGYGSDAVMCEAESRGIVYLFKIRRSTYVRRLFKTLADGAGWSDCGFGWQAAEVSLRLDGWARGRRVLFIRRPAEKRVEVVEPKRRRRKRTPSPKDGVVVPTVPGRLKQEEFEFVEEHGRGGHLAALPRQGRLREQLRRVQEPVGLGGVHHPQAEAVQGDGAAHRNRRQLVERVLPPCRSDGPPRGDNLAPGVHVDHGPYRRERAKANNPSHFHACRFDADSAGVGHGRGVLQVARFNCRAVGRKDALDNRRPLRFSQNTASRPRIEPLVRAQVARRTHFDWTKPGLASEAGRAALSRREKTPQLRFN